ncbi:MAG: hypothetical protein Tsb0014_18170 [Pleurocapsa sp.]
MTIKTWWQLLISLSLGIILSVTSHSLATAESSPQLAYQIYQRSQYTIHTVTIPHDSKYIVTPALKEELTSITDFATEYDAAAVINGGYFDPVNQKTTSHIIQETKIVADPRFNERLIDNPDLQPYIGKILNRAEFRRYLCREAIQYDIQLHSAPVPSNCTLQDTLGGGPALLPQDTSVAEGFVAYQNGAKIRDAIGFDSPNARSVIGIKNNGDLILVMAAQKPNLKGNSGISLPDLANFLVTIDVVKAMNLDGGSSSSLYYDSQAFYGKLDKDDNQVKREIKSVLLVIQK